MENMYYNNKGEKCILKEIDGHWHAFISNGEYTSSSSYKVLHERLIKWGFRKLEKKFPKGDDYFKETVSLILKEGTVDINPRPHYEDIVECDNWEYLEKERLILAYHKKNKPEKIHLKENQEIKKGPLNECIICTPAHTMSYNHIMHTYDLNKGEFPIITLRPIATKAAIGEILWIYQDMSNDLDLLKEKYKVSWWDEWDIGNRTIGSCYGATIKKHNMMKKLIEDLTNNPDGRRHIMNMWQEEDFKDTHGLKPCAFQTIWNVRHGRDGVDYLDMMLTQRSSDYITAGAINQVQYAVLLTLIARHIGCVPGKFTWSVANVQIYDRHIAAAKELLNRNSVDCNPTIWVNPQKKNFWDITLDDIKVINYPLKDIQKVNPKIKLDIGI